jgi:archaellum component FlaC
MATEKTPPHKRIKRAEEGRDDWRVKAFQRREEIEKIKIQLKTREKHIDALNGLLNDFKNELNNAKKIIKELEQELSNLKKKL